MYIDFTEPISLKQYFGDSLNRERRSLKPVHQQEFTPEDRKLISSLAYDVVRIQQNHSVITAFNLVTTLINNNIITSNKPYTKKELVNEVKWLKNIMEILGALVSTDHESLEDILVVHKNFIQGNEEGRIDLIYSDIDLSTVNPEKLKGHSLSNETMKNVIPMVFLQIYMNPCIHFLANSSIIMIILRCRDESIGIRQGNII